ncbi:RHS repeat-associated core domain-containing protein [Lysobacter sp. A3-1-A15]|uniref:RHS repeat-associated core domain-containing protein n=1 Tax=Novilysobacter viscosus TaxID=3098602 RepID=UPI002EDBB4C5
MLLAAVPGMAFAQLVYEAVRHMPGQEVKSFATLAAAEQWIQEEPATPIGNSYLQRTSEKNYINGRLTLNYSVTRRPYMAFFGDFYKGHMSGNATACNAQKIPIAGVSDYGCDTEQAMMEASLRAYPLSGSYSGSLRGQYLPMPPTMWGVVSFESDPDYSYISVHRNNIQYSGGAVPNQREVVATNSSGTSTFVYRVLRNDIYQCPKTFYGIHNTYGQANVTWPYVCGNNSRGSISVRLRQRAPSCEIDTKTGNPCVADSGNKEYVESDFVWEGRAFDRTYNSLGDMPLGSGFGDNWSHGFSDKLMMPEGLYGSIYWIRKDGYYESFSRASEGVYKSSVNPGLVLRREPDAVAMTQGRWRLVVAGATLWFSESGRLKQLVGNDGRTFALKYCDGQESACPVGMLTEVQSSSGRRLSFQHLEAPDGSFRTVRIASEGTVLAEYLYDLPGRLQYVSYGLQMAGAGKEYVYGESEQLCRNHLGEVLGGCDPAHFPNHLTGVVDELDRRFATYSYDSSGRVSTSEHAGGKGRVTMNYRADGAVEVSLPQGARKLYRFNADFFKKPTSLELHHDNGSTTSASATYASGRLSALTNESGSRTSYVYDSLRLVSRTEGLSATGARTVNSRTYQTDWDPASDRALERRVYDSQAGIPGTLLTRTTYVYNDLGRVSSSAHYDVTAGASRSTHYLYCEEADVATGLCPVAGLLLSVDGARSDLSDVSTYTYRLADDPECATAPTTCAYRKGDLSKVTNALGHVTETLRYDGAGRPLSVRDPNGIVTDMEYHPRGWLTARKVRGPDTSTESDDAITRIEYEPIGLVKRVIQPDGTFTAYTYDAAHRLTAISDGAGNRITYTLDNAGSRLKEDTQDSGGTLLRTLSRVYNQLGQLHAANDAYSHSTAFTYDAGGNADTVTDPLGRVTDNDYDPLGRLSRTLQDVNGIQAETRFDYDALDNLTQVTDPKGLSTRYQYNGFGDLTQLASPDTGTSTYTYDSAGNRVSSTDARGQLTVYAYDALNRLTGIGYDDTGLDVSYVYDVAQDVCQVGETFAVGRMTRMQDGSGATQYCFDRRGNLVRKVQTTNGMRFTVRYSYTLAGRLASMTYPSGTRVDYARDALGQASAITVTRPDGSIETLLSDVAYYPFGPASALQYGDGRLLQRSLNQNYQPGFIEDTRPDGLSLGYQFDAAGNLVTLRRGDQSEPSLRTYGYDGLNRLTDVGDGSSGASLRGYAYDATGNRTHLTEGGVAVQYGYAADSHRLVDIAGAARQYDAAGNILATDGSARTFAYNAAGRMSQASRNGEPLMQYTYNGRGEQVRRLPLSAGDTSQAAAGERAARPARDKPGKPIKPVKPVKPGKPSKPGKPDEPGRPENPGRPSAPQPSSGLQESYAVYDEAGRWLGGYDSAGTRVQEVIWLDDLPVGLIAGDHLHYIQPDHLGTPRTVIDPARQQAVWTWSLEGEAFGDTVPNEDHDGDGRYFTLDMRYPGQRYDAASGLNYNYFRDYDPGTGRYVQSDPIGIAGGMATYGYGGGNPVAAYDRYGLCWSNARAAGHYFAGGGRAVSLNEIGCTSMVASQVQPERNIWKSRIKAAARTAAQVMACGSWQRITAARSVGVSSGIFWIGGFSLLQDSNCIVQRNCGSNAGMQCGRDSYSFECLLTSRMHDLFVNPSDFDNSARTSSPDFWDEYSYGGTPFYVDAAWYDSIKGGGSL